MKAHKINAHGLAEALAKSHPEMGDGTVTEWLADIRQHPEIYYADHVDVSDSQGVLPLSETAWRRTCLSR